MNTAFTKGVVLELESNIKVAVLDSYAIDAKNIRIIVIAEDFDIRLLNFNIDTDKISNEYCYNTASIVAALRQNKIEI